MPVPRLVAAFLTDGYYMDHVGTLSFSSRTSTSAAATPLVFLSPNTTTTFASISTTRATPTTTPPAADACPSRSLPPQADLHGSSAAFANGETINTNNNNDNNPATKGESTVSASKSVVIGHDGHPSTRIELSEREREGREANLLQQLRVDSTSTAVQAGPLPTFPSSPSSSPHQCLPSSSSAFSPPLPAELSPHDVRKATNVILTALQDLSDEAQQAVLDLPANTLYFMNPLTRDMSVGVIRTTVPRRYLPLYGSAVTPAPLDSYMHQLITLFRSSPEEIIIALVLIAKVSTRIPICSLSIARAFLAAMVVSSKVRADERTAMRVYATFGGVEVADLLAMERSFLTALGFNAGVRPESFVDMLYSLRQYCVYLADEGVEWAAKVWSDFAPLVPIPDIRHLDAMLEESGGEDAPRHPLTVGGQA